MGFVVSYCGECGQRISSGSDDDTRLHSFSDRFLCAPCHRKVSTTRLRVRRIVARAVPEPSGTASLMTICQKFVHRAKRSAAVAARLS